MKSELLSPHVMGWSFIESLGMQSPFVLWFIPGIKHLLGWWYWEVRRNREGNKSWIYLGTHLQGSSNTVLLWKWPNGCDLCCIDICKFYANNHLMPECGPEEESFMAPGVLLAHHSECLNQPRRYQVPWPAWHCLQQLVQERISPVVPFSGLSSCFAHFTPDVLSSFLKHARQTPAPGPSCCISAWNTAPSCRPGSLLCFTQLFTSAVALSLGLPWPRI